MVAGLLINLNPTPFLPFKRRPKISAAQRKAGVFTSAQRHRNQVGPTLPDGSWHDFKSQWYDGIGNKTSEPADPVGALQRANANWIHPVQDGATLRDGKYRLKSAGNNPWRNPDGTVANTPTPQELAADNPLTVSDPTEEEPEATPDDLHGWTYSTSEGNSIAPVNADPSSLLLNFPVQTAPPSGSPLRTTVRTFEPFKQDSQGYDHPAPGLVLKNARGTCDSGSNDDPGRAIAFRCNPPGNGVVCFHRTQSGDAGSPLVCSADPTSNQAVLLDQGGSQLPLNFANKEDPAAPAWVLVLADGKKCYHLGYGTDTAVLSYYCGGNVDATVPDRSSPLWTVQEGTFAPKPSPSGPRIAVVTAYR